MNDGQTVRQAQQLHHLTHPLALREAVAVLTENLDTGVTILVRPDQVDEVVTTDIHDRDVPVHTATTAHVGCTHDSLFRCTHSHTHTHLHGAIALSDADRRAFVAEAVGARPAEGPQESGPMTLATRVPPAPAPWRFSHTRARRSGRPLLSYVAVVDVCPNTSHSPP